MTGTDADSDQLLDQKEAARLLGLSARTLERMRRDRSGPSFIKFSSRAIRYSLADLKTWCAARRVVCDQQ